MKINSFMTNHIKPTNKTETNINNTLEKISAMREISETKDSINQINDELSIEILEESSHIQNANQMIGMMQIADNSLSSIKDGAIKLQELSVRNASDTLNSSQKSMLSNEFKSTLTQIKDVLQNSTYNGKNIFDSNFKSVTNSGVINVDIAKINLNDLSIRDQKGIKDFVKELDSISNTIGSSTNQLKNSLENSLKSITKSITKSIKKDDSKKSEIKLNPQTISQIHKTDILQKRVASLLNF